jgi:WD40 repeat protein/mannitol/fructose-specific phosphotransferase system IIA component (Ntr-type)/phosphotransferase system HPr-like phosphotransfer protein
MVCSRSATLINKGGLHLRSWLQLEKLGGTFDSQIEIARESNVVLLGGGDPSAIPELSSGTTLNPGDTIEIIATGPDEEQAVSALCDLVENGFGEALASNPNSLLSNMLKPLCVKVPLEATDKWGAIEELLQLLGEQHGFEPSASILRMLQERESLSPRGTCIGKSIAIPHCYDAGVSGQCIAIGTAPEPISWSDDPSDDALVEIVVLALSGGAKEELIPALATISEVLKPIDVRGKIRRATTRGVVYRQVLREQEAMRSTHDRGVNFEQDFTASEIEEDRSPRYRIAWSPDGNLLAGAYGRPLHRVRVWRKTKPDSPDEIAAHDAAVYGLAWSPDGQFLASASADGTVHITDMNDQKRVHVLNHPGTSLLSDDSPFLHAVHDVAYSPDGSVLVSVSHDFCVRIWNTTTGDLLHERHEHKAHVYTVEWSPTQEYFATGSGTMDNAEIVIWDGASFDPVKRLVIEEVGSILSVAWSPDGSLVAAGLSNRKARIWRAPTLDPVAVLEGHTDLVTSVDFSHDGKLLASKSTDGSVRLWSTAEWREVASLEERGGKTAIFGGLAFHPLKSEFASLGEHESLIRTWKLNYSLLLEKSPSTESVRYTNAKVVLLGDTGAGKTGLMLRLAEGKFEATASTDAHWATQMKMPAASSSDKIDREIWLWDFAGQPDYQLIHQIFLDETALAVLVFNPQSENPFESLAHWDRGLAWAGKPGLVKLLVAGRCDRGGLMISRKAMLKFAREHGFAGFLETSALTGDGCERLRDEILSRIDWESIPWTASPRIFKLLRDGILKLRDEGVVLLRMGELKRRLETQPIGETFIEEELRAVVGLLASPGLVWKLDFGDIVMLQPEWINKYAAAVIRSIRAQVGEIGVIDESQVLAGELNYTLDAVRRGAIRVGDPVTPKMQRLPESDEAIVLRAMHQMFVDRRLCVREEREDGGRQLIFPSYFKQELPLDAEHPPTLVSYQFTGHADEVYATLVVQLWQTKAFENGRLWRYAADFKSATGKRLGLRMVRYEDSTPEICVYFDQAVQDDTKVTFIKYVHEHLLRKARDVVRWRAFVCPHCGHPVTDTELARRVLERHGKEAQIRCQDPTCDKRFPLWDVIEEKFASEKFQERVQRLEATAKIAIDNESSQLILEGHARVITGEAGHIYRSYPRSDQGIDGEIEFRDDSGQPSGKRLYLQLRSGDSYLFERKPDGAEVFQVKVWRWAEYWQSQPYPVMLVNRRADGQIHWMDITAALVRQSSDPESSSGLIAFEGEPFTAINLHRMRGHLLRDDREETSALHRRAVEASFPEERVAALKTLAAESPNTYTRDFLYQRVDEEEDEEVRRRLIEILAEKWHDEETRAAIERRAYEDRSPAVRQTAILALVGHWPNDATREILLHVSEQDKHAEIRATAADALIQASWHHLAVRQRLRKRVAEDSPNRDPDDSYRHRILAAITGSRDWLSGRWEAHLSGREVSGVLPECRPGYPAIRVASFRLRNICVFEDTGEIALNPGVNVLLGENASGKTTILRCLALAALGPVAANEVEPEPARYLRHNQDKGTIEVLFELIPDPDAFPSESGFFAVGLQITSDSKRFSPLESSISLTPPDGRDSLRNSVEQLGEFRDRKGFPFGFISGYGATRTFTESDYAPQVQAAKPENDWVLSLFHPQTWLSSPDVLAKLLRGRTLGIEGAPEDGLDTHITEALLTSLDHLLPGVERIVVDGDTDVTLNHEDLAFADLSDGYRSILALAGHLLRCSLRLGDWKVSTTAIHGVSLVDEVDLHLHPAWQRRVMGDLPRAFKNMQWITTSHSPLVAGSLDKEAVFVLRREGDCVRPYPLKSLLPDGKSLRGRRADQILTSILFGLATSRDIETERLMQQYASMLHAKGPEDGEVQRRGREISGLLALEGEGEIDQKTYELLDNLLQAKFESLDDEQKKLILANAGLRLAE